MLSSRAITAQRELKGAIEAVRTAHANVVKAAATRAAQALCAAYRQAGETTGEMFKNVSGGNGDVIERQCSASSRNDPNSPQLDLTRR